MVKCLILTKKASQYIGVEFILGKKDDKQKYAQSKENRTGLIMGIVIAALIVIFIALFILNKAIDGGLASVFSKDSKDISSESSVVTDDDDDIDDTDDDIDADERHGYPETEDQLTSDYQLSAPAKGETIAVVTTSKGVIKFKFFPENAPKAVENFIQQAKKGYYDNTKFTAIYNDQCILSDGDQNTIFGEYFEDEYSINVHNFKGALGCSKAGSEDTNTNQFYIITNSHVDEGTIEAMSGEQAQSMGLGFSEEIIAKYASLGGDPTLDGQFTVFGQLYEGWDVVDALNKVQSKDADNGDYSVAEDVTIVSVEIKEN